MTKYDFDTVIDRYGTYSDQWDYVRDRFGVDNLLPFTISDMDFATAPGVRDVLVKASQKGIFGYTHWDNPAFKGAIAGWYDRRFHVTVDQDSIVYSPSVIFTLAKLLEQFSKPGDKVVTFSPCYDAFIKTITANDRLLLEVDINNGVDWDGLDAYFAREHPAVFVLCNPHNPLGIVWSGEEMQRMVELCNAYHVAFIADEIHMGVVRRGTVVHSLAGYFDQLTGQKAVISSAGKAFNITALGGSFALLTNARDREEFVYGLEYRSALSSIPYLGMLGLIEAFDHQEDWLNQLCDYIDGNFAYLQKFLKDELGLDYQIPAGTYLAWIDITPLGITMPALQDEMIHHQKVAIMDGRMYGNGGAHYLRFNLGAPRSKVAEGLKRLAAAVKVVQAKA